MKPAVFAILIGLMVTSIATPRLSASDTTNIDTIESQTIEAEGVAAISPTKSLDRARDEALEDALRKAVEQGVGVYVNSQTMTENFQVIADNILTKAAGYVRSYKIIEEKKDDQFYRIKIVAEVAMAKLRDDLAAIELYKKLVGYPRIMVIASEKIDGQQSDSVSVQTALEEILVKKNFELIDRTQLERMKERDVALHQEDVKQAAALGERLGAEILVLLDANADFAGEDTIYGMNFFKYRANLTSRIVKVDTASLVDTAQITGLGSDTGKDSAARKALQEAAAKIAPTVIDKILEGWRKEVHAGATRLELVVHNADFDSTNKIVAALKEIRTVKSVGEPGLSKGTAIFHLSAGIQARKLAEHLSQIADPKLKVTGLSQNRVEAEIQQ
jgi:hypothetical protein